jgi:thymidylate synthase
LGDAHIYKNHIPQAKLQLERLPKKLPKMTLDNRVRDIFGFCYESFEIKDYDPAAHIAAQVAV